MVARPSTMRRGTGSRLFTGIRIIFYQFDDPKLIWNCLQVFIKGSFEGFDGIPRNVFRIWWFMPMLLNFMVWTLTLLCVIAYIYMYRVFICSIDKLELDKLKNILNMFWILSKNILLLNNGSLFSDMATFKVCSVL